MKPIIQPIEEDNLTEFDNKMIIEMKAIHELQNWSDQQLEEYCYILKCYSKLIISAVENEKYNSEEKLTFKITSTPLKQAA
jgi:hypothetical protein